ncbi:3'-5' exonuclease [Paraconexibacter sp. AEG42_29]
MARHVDGSLVVFLIRERDDFYKRIGRVRPTFDARDFTELTVDRQRTQLVEARADPPTTAPSVPASGACWKTFSDDELRAIFPADDALITRLGQAARPAEAFEDDVVGVIGEPHAMLLLDLAERPDRYRRILDSGRIPAPIDVEDSDEELAASVAAGLATGDLVALEEASELERLLDGELEEWMVFLLPKQRSMVDARYNGPARLSGGPGTGKSVVALHRAIELARRAGPREKVLLTTFVKTLPVYWRSLLRRIDPAAAARVDVKAVDALAHWWLPPDVQRLDIPKPPERVAWAKHALGRDLRLIGAFGNDPAALVDEFDHVLSAAVVPGVAGANPHPLSSGEDYGRLEPKFRRARTREEVESVWACFERYREDLAAQGMTDFAQRRLVALERASPTYAGVVVDEAQDLSSVALRFLWKLDASVDHSGFLVVADGQQAVYPGGYSLRALGIETRGRARNLTENWRTTQCIQAAADSVIADLDIDDRDGTARRGADDESIPLRAGIRPEVHACRHRHAETTLVADIVLDRITAGRVPRDIAVLVSTNKQVGEVLRALANAPLPVPARDLKDFKPEQHDYVVVGTFHRAKGLEFVEVVVAGLGDGTWPPSHGAQTQADRDERSRHCRALFVAMTRARDHLIMTGVAPLAPEVAALSPICADLVTHA